MFNIRASEQKKNLSKHKSSLILDKIKLFSSFQYITNNTLNKHISRKDQVINSYTIKFSELNFISSKYP
jgi:hypothetical protein